VRGRATRYFDYCLVLLGGLCLAAHAESTLPCVFADHMVLQRSDHVPVWGKADAGQEVTVSIAGLTARTEAGSDGHWQLDIDLHASTGGPYVLVVQAGKTFTFSDVLVGEVWFASGQSNMEFLLANALDGPQEIAHSANAQLRQFYVPSTGAIEPAESCNGKWSIASPETSGHFTAVGYYFAKELQSELHVPVGLIHASQGASGIESWMSREGLERVPALLHSANDRIEEARTFQGRMARYRLDYQQWQLKWHRDDPPLEAEKYAAPDIDLKGWRAVSIGGNFEESSLSSGGVVWLRKTIEITQGMVDARYHSFHLGSIRDTDHVYINGIEIGQTTADKRSEPSDRERADTTRRYDITGNTLKAGKATLAIRIFDPVTAPVITGMAQNEIELQGPWSVKDAYAEPPADEQARAAFPRAPAAPADQRFVATELFNAMVNPVIPYAIRGVIWYQGESNIPRAWQYRSSFPAMIEDWRQHWDQPKLPFYFCQIANYTAKTSEPKDAIRAELRDAQTSALTLPDTGQAITFDIGEENDVHPRDKKSVGHRLALIALSREYGKNVIFSGPVYQSIERDGAAMRIHFTSIGEGLKAAPVPSSYELNSAQKVVVPLVRNSPNSQLEGFQICGSDHRWVWADAKIDRDTVLVSSSQVTEPVAVRYGWAENPTVNLYNSAGLPAGPFRTDDFPLSTRNAKY